MSLEIMFHYVLDKKTILELKKKPFTRPKIAVFQGD